MNSTASSRRRAKTRCALACLAILASLCALRFSSLGANARIEERARQRIATRVATAQARMFITRPNANERARADERDVITQRRDRMLVRAAREYLERVPNASSRAVARGMARWNVAARQAREFINAQDDDAIFRETPTLSVPSLRRELRESARDARRALDALRDEPRDRALDDALAFLEEFDESGDDEREDDDAFLWALDFNDGDPIDASGFARVDDFAAPCATAFARRLADASTRFLLLAALGAVAVASVREVAAFVVRLSRATRGFARAQRRAATLRAVAPRFDFSSSLAQFTTVRLID